MEIRKPKNIHLIEIETIVRDGINLRIVTRWSNSVNYILYYCRAVYKNPPILIIRDFSTASLRTDNGLEFVA
jgi:hypothetical protein